MKLAEQARQEKEEHERIVKRQLEEVENDRRIEEEKKKMRYENKAELEKMIKIKEELSKVGYKEVLEEGRVIKQNNDDWRQRMEKIKQEKIEELKKLNIVPKYIADLEKFKIV